MNTYGLNPVYQPIDPSRRLKGIAVVVVLHILIIYGVVSGTARKGLNLLKKPLEAVVIQEVIIPPPPPPPPKKVEPPKQVVKTEAPPPPFVPPPDVAPQVSSNAPSIAAVAVAPVAPHVIAPPTPPAPKPVPAGPKVTSIGLACPTQVPPEMPRRAIKDGIEGVVKAQILVKDGVVKDVNILSGPRVFHAPVRDAMLQYKCTNTPGEVLATQEFVFKIE